jgi:hypothetical protein
MSTLVAGVIAAVVLYAIVNWFDANNQNKTLYLVFGFFTGVLTQVGIRLTGVS